MFKPLIAAALGLSAMATVVHADTIVVQSGPHTLLPHISGPANFGTAYDTPSFTRMVEQCARMGFDCGAPDVADYDGPHPLFSPEAQADAGKRLALMRLDWEEYAADLPDPRHPSPTFGWNTGPDARDILSWIAPHADLRPHTFPHVAPNTFGFRNPALPRHNGFWGPTLTQPLAVPRITVPHVTLPRATFPRLTHPRSLPHGGLIPWPTL
jgi:hypothetical protein